MPQTLTDFDAEFTLTHNSSIIPFTNGLDLNF